MSSMRVLVVGDYAPFVQFIRSTFADTPDMQVIGEVADGLEAVQKAELLEPDLVLLDIGLPTLNGIEAAKRIRKCSPTSKIIFLTQENDPDIRIAALSTGAEGYLLKGHAMSELLAVVEAVLRIGHSPRAVSSD